MLTNTLDFGQITVEFSPPPPNSTPGNDRRREAAFSAAVRAQIVPHAIAPECRVKARRGWLEGGQEITEDDVGVRNLSELVDRRIVIHITPEEVVRRTPPEDARYLVDPQGKAVISRARGVLAPGAPCDAQDFAEPPKGQVALPNGEIVPGRPATDGTATLQRLIEIGRIVDLNAKRKTPPPPAAA